jgi:hypothetical protein
MKFRGPQALNDTFVLQIVAQRVQESARRNTIRHANLLKSNEHVWARSLS